MDWSPVVGSFLSKMGLAGLLALLAYYPHRRIVESRASRGKYGDSFLEDLTNPIIILGTGAGASALASLYDIYRQMS